MFDRLMGGAIFPQSYAVVRHGVYDRLVHQSCQPDSRSCIVREDEKCGGIGSQTTVQLNPCGSGTHSKFPNPPGDIASFRIALLKIRTVFDQRFGRRFQISTTPHQPGEFICYRIEECTVEGTGSFGAITGLIDREISVPVFREGMVKVVVKLLCKFWMIFLIGDEFIIPFLFFFFSFGDGESHMFQDLVRNEKWLFGWKIIIILRLLDFLISQR